MPQNRRIDRIPAKLLSQDGTVYNVEVDVAVRANDHSGIEEILSILWFAYDSPVAPDGGPYVFRYVFNGHPYEHRVRILNGRFVTANG